MKSLNVEQANQSTEVKKVTSQHMNAHLRFAVWKVLTCNLQATWIIWTDREHKLYCKLCVLFWLISRTFNRQSFGSNPLNLSNAALVVGLKLQNFKVLSTNRRYELKPPSGFRKVILSLHTFTDRATLARSAIGKQFRSRVSEIKTKSTLHTNVSWWNDAETGLKIQRKAFGER